jgi:hypothetical protein
MTYKSRYFFWAFLLFCTLAVIIFVILSSLRGGIISPQWGFYMIEWPLIGITGLIAYILSLIKVIKKKAPFGYVFLCVANFCNSAIGAYILLINSTSGMQNIWFAIGASMCLSFLIAMDILM